jgi:DNA-binding response OmpR family regulator
VIEAASGGEGLALFRERKPDLVLCDLMLPDRSGFETLRAIRAVNLSARIVAVSGTLFGVADHETMVHRLSLAGMVEKPFRARKLVEAVRKALA